MAAESRDMPPVRLLPESELARLVRAVPLFEQAARLARWTAPQIRVDAAGDLDEAQLGEAAAELELGEQAEAVAETAEAWAFAIDAGLVEVAEDGDGATA